MPESECAHSSYDVVILGGGPAGAATALALKRLDSALRIAIIERSDYSGIRVGETLPPSARTLLAGLGVWEAFLATASLPSYGTRAAWGSPHFHENEFIFSVYGHGWHLERRVFDAMLTKEAEQRGIELIQPALPFAASRNTDCWILGIKFHKDICRDISTRFVVDATGRRSWFASKVGMRHVVYDQLAGIFTFYRFRPGGTPADSYTSIEAREQGWWYSAMLPKEGMVVAFMTDVAQLRQLRWKSCAGFESLVEQAPFTAHRISTAIPIGSPVLQAAASQRLETCAGESWLAVGDAASTFDPLSSQGIVKGLRSGIGAARSICRYLCGRKHALKEYADFLDREYSKYLDARAAYYRLEQRWPDSSFWQLRQKAITFQPLRGLPLNHANHVNLINEGYAISSES
jgi:2-polyprenyl-6-methoxyphenol hydroxylase-like FAD-dependent oxidoreductase